MLYESFVHSLKASGLEPATTRWVLAVSGGLDSAVLLHLASRLIPFYGTRFDVLHVDHQLRKPISAGEGEIIKRWCEALRLPFETRAVDVSSFATTEKCTIQEAARLLRRRQLTKRALEVGADGVWTAHHASDAVEWFLLNLLRGSGTDGLAGMRFRQREWVKPLLQFTRSDLESYARQHQIVFMEDASNQSFDYARNRIRLELIPELSRFGACDAEASILRSVQNLREDREYLERVSSIEFEKLAIKKHGEVIFPLLELRKLTASIRRRIYQKAVSELFRDDEPRTPQLERRHIDLIETLEREHELPNGVTVFLSRGRLTFYRKLEQESIYPKVLPVPGVIDVLASETRWITIVQPYAEKAEPWAKASPMSVYMDFTKIEGPLRLRPVRESDVFDLDDRQSVSCTRYLKSLQIPKRHRDQAFVVEDNRGILWLAPHRISNLCRIDENTRLLLKIQARPLRHATLQTGKKVVELDT